MFIRSGLSEIVAVSEIETVIVIGTVIATATATGKQASIAEALKICRQSCVVLGLQAKIDRANPA